MYALTEGVFDKVDMFMDNKRVVALMNTSIPFVRKARPIKIAPSDEKTEPETQASLPIEAPSAVDAPTTPTPTVKPKKKTQAERMAEMSAPRIRDERIKPGYKLGSGISSIW